MAAGGIPWQRVAAAGRMPQQIAAVRSRSQQLTLPSLFATLHFFGFNCEVPPVIIRGFEIALALHLLISAIITLVAQSLVSSLSVCLQVSQ